jgi:hypothetical protein
MNWYGTTVSLTAATTFSGSSGSNILFRPLAGLTQTISGSSFSTFFSGDIQCVGPGTVRFSSNFNHTTRQSGSYSLVINTSIIIDAGVTLQVGGVTTTVTAANGALTPRTVTCNGVISLYWYQSTGGVDTLFSTFSLAVAAGMTWEGTGHVLAVRTNNMALNWGGTNPPVAGAPNVVIPATSATMGLSMTGTFNTVTLQGTAYTALSSSRTINCRNFSMGGGSITNLFVTFVADPLVGPGGLYTLSSYNNISLAGITMFHTADNAGTVTLTASGSFTQLTLNGALVLRGGTLDLGGVNVSCLTAQITAYVAVAGYSTRGINFGSNFITLTTSTASQVNIDGANISDAAFTDNDGGFRATMSVARTFTVGTTGRNTAALPSLYLLSGASVATITTGGFFKVLSYGSCTFTQPVTSLTVTSLILGNGSYISLVVTIGNGDGTLANPYSKSISSPLTINNFSAVTNISNNITFNGSTATTTLTAGTLTFSGSASITTGIFSSSNSNIRQINFGSSGSIVLNHSTAGTQCISMNNAFNFTATGTNGFRAAMTVARTFLIGAQAKPTVAPNLFITSGSGGVTLGARSYFDNLNFTGSTSYVEGTGGGPVFVDTLTLATGGSYVNFLPIFTRTQTWTSQFSKQLGGIGVTGTGVTLTLDGTQTYFSGGSMYLEGGTLDLGGATHNIGMFVTQNVPSGTPRTIQGPGTINVSNLWAGVDAAGVTGSNYTINMTASSAQTFAGAGGSYGTLVQAGTGALTIYGNNTFADIQATTRPSTITFAAGTTQSLANFTLSGTAGNLVTINSDTPGTQFTLTKPSGTLTLNYLSIQDSNVTGGAYWGTTTSTFVSNNTGWNALLSMLVTGQFMAFF